MYTTASGKNTENALRAKKITWDWKDFRFWFYAIRLSCGQNYCYWKHFLCSAQELVFCKFIFQWPFYPIGISWGLVLFMQDKKMVFDDSILIFWNPWFEIWMHHPNYHNMKNDKNVLYWLNVPNSIFYYGNKILRRKRTRTNFRFKIDA